MYCKYCNTEKEESDFPMISFKGAPYRSKRCEACRKIFWDRKNNQNIINKAPTAICPKCKKPFEITYSKSKRPFKRCPICRKAHAKIQARSLQNQYKDRIKDISLLNDTKINNISRQEIINAIVDRLVDKLFIGKGK